MTWHTSPAEASPVVTVRESYPGAAHDQKDAITLCPVRESNLGPLCAISTTLTTQPLRQDKSLAWEPRRYPVCLSYLLVVATTMTLNSPYLPSGAGVVRLGSWVVRVVSLAHKGPRFDSRTGHNVMADFWSWAAPGYDSLTVTACLASAGLVCHERVRPENLLVFNPLALSNLQDPILSLLTSDYSSTTG